MDKAFGPPWVSLSGHGCTTGEVFSSAYERLEALRGGRFKYAMFPSFILLD